MKIESTGRTDISKLIVDRLQEQHAVLKSQFLESKDKIGFFYIDDLLPENLVKEIDQYFPSTEDMVLKKSLRENKHVAAQMDKYHPLLEEVIYAFQQDNVVKEINKICGIQSLFPDENLYAGGLSSMKRDQFLNPHLDNSHDKDRNRWRVLNLLYYVTPGWSEVDGGHLELWPEGLENEQIVIHSLCNRLIVMATHDGSWHSVSPVKKDGSRNCISNYYFSEKALRKNDNFHVTTFRGRPEQKFRNQILKIDSYLRMNLRKVFKKGLRDNPHVYKKNEGDDL